MDGVLQLIGFKSKLLPRTANQKVGKLSHKPPAQGYRCDCGQTECVLLLSASSVTVNTFCFFFSTSAPLPSKSFSPAISIVHSLTHISPLLRYTLSHSVLSCYVLSTMPALFSTAPLVLCLFLLFHYLSHSPSLCLSHLPLLSCSRL